MDPSDGGLRRLHNEDRGFDSNRGGVTLDEAVAWATIGEAQAMHATGTAAAPLDPSVLR
ncbi:MAG: hypothetical protein M3527_03475 [Actinomycetota bacterium]|nr:hypothetical protein [Acidimicrobiia bacterium]MDQ3293496.1 hypothetical protein [Actinomycetota bacterium]